MGFTLCICIPSNPAIVYRVALGAVVQVALRHHDVMYSDVRRTHVIGIKTVYE